MEPSNAFADAPHMHFVETRLGWTEKANRREIDQLFTDSSNEWLAKTPELEAWCAAFAWCALDSADMERPNGVAAVRAKEYGEAIATPVTTPRYGDLALLNYGNTGPVDHVTFYTGPDPHNRTRFIGTGGNQSDSVKRSSFALSDAKFYRPRPRGNVNAVTPRPEPGTPVATPRQLTIGEAIAAFFRAIGRAFRRGK